MAFYVIPQRYLVRGDTEAVLAARNEILMAREQCIETDTGRFKFGDGVTPWNDLDYASAESSGDSSDGQVPTLVAEADTYTVAENKQVLFSLPITVDGLLIVDGFLVEV